MLKLKSLFLAGSLITIAGCSENGKGSSAEQSRWYTPEQVSRGNALYQVNCARCHKPDASGHVNAEQDYSAPALNGTEHTWHHPLSSLRRTIKFGGIRLGGTMPGFSEKLSQEEIDNILAWVQSHWSDEIYTAWKKRNQKKQ